MEKEQEEKEINGTTAENIENQVEEQEGQVKEAETNEEDQATAENELAEAKDKYLRLYSEFENFRRRTSKEKLDLISTANKDLMSDLLPVLDDFERAMAAEGENEEGFRKGVELIQQKLSKVMEVRGLKKIKVKKGDKFDDEKHEAITQIPAEKKLEGKIVDVIEAGYTLGETVVRFAKVVVGAKQ